MTRREMLLGAAAAGLALPDGAMARERDKLFKVFRNGREIGWHRLTFTETAVGRTVDIEIEMDVKLAFITVYRYRHTNREVWEDGRFVSFASRTDDNGTRYEVVAAREGEGIVVEGPDGRVVAPGAALPTTYWSADFLEAQPWIDTQHGRLVRAVITPLGAAMVNAAGSRVDAERFRLNGDLAADLWYANGHWVKLAFAGPDGSAIEYELDRASFDLAAG
jgi:hypothetical protein